MNIEYCLELGIWFLEFNMSFDPNKTAKLLFSCLDWRLHPAIDNYFAKENIACDMCVTAGSLKGLLDPQTQDFFLKQIETSKNLHHCQEIVLTMHIDCGAYGGSAAFANAEEEITCYKNELKRAKQTISGKFPEIKISTWIVDLKNRENNWQIVPKSMDL